jgi:hypothetical protein
MNTTGNSIEREAPPNSAMPRNKRAYLVFFFTFFGYVAVSSVWDSIAAGHRQFQVWGPGLIVAIMFAWLDARHNPWRR